MAVYGNINYNNMNSEFYLESLMNESQIFDIDFVNESVKDSAVNLFNKFLKKIKEIVYMIKDFISKKLSKIKSKISKGTKGKGYYEFLKKFATNTNIIVSLAPIEHIDIKTSDGSSLFFEQVEKEYIEKLTPEFRKCKSYNDVLDTLKSLLSEYEKGIYVLDYTAADIKKIMDNTKGSYEVLTKGIESLKKKYVEKNDSKNLSEIMKVISFNTNTLGIFASVSVNAAKTLLRTSEDGESSTITPEFQRAVEESKLRARIMLKDSLLVDRTFSQFDGMIKYAESYISDLYDKNEDDFPEEFTKDNMNMELTKLPNNFSKERISWLKKCITIVYK